MKQESHLFKLFFERMAFFIKNNVLKKTRFILQVLNHLFQMLYIHNGNLQGRILDKI